MALPDDLPNAGAAPAKATASSTRSNGLTVLDTAEVSRCRVRLGEFGAHSLGAAATGHPAKPLQASAPRLPLANLGSVLGPRYSPRAYAPRSPHLDHLWAVPGRLQLRRAFRLQGWGDGDVPGGKGLPGHYRRREGGGD